jgi:outer membrane protein assembly factor BamB
MRKTSALAIAAGLVLSSAISAYAATTSPTTASWRQTDGSASESRANIEESTLTLATVARAKLRHSLSETKASPGCSKYGPTSPLLSATHLFVVAGGHLKQYNADTGQLGPQYPLFFASTTNYARVALGQGLVVAGGTDCTSQSDPNGEVLALNSTTGSPVWAWGGPALRDLVESGQIVVISGGTSGSGNYVDGLNLRDGSTVWSAFPDCLHGPTPVAGGKVIVSGCQRTRNGNGAPQLSALDVAQGRPAWTRAGNWTVYRADSDTDPHAQVYVRNPHGHTVALNSQTGKPLYRLRGARDVAVADDRRVYATCGRGTRFCAYDKATGAKLWRVDHSAGPGGTLASVGDDVVYLDDGRALNALTGKQLTRLWSTGKASSLAVGRGHVAAVVDGVHTNIYGLPG